MVSTLIAWHLEMLSMIEDMMSPRFFLSFSSLANPFSNVAYSSTASYSSSNFEAGPAEHTGSVEISSNTILQKSNNFPYIWIDTLIYKYESI